MPAGRHVPPRDILRSSGGLEVGHELERDPLAALFDRLGRYEPAATIAGFAFSPFTAATPELTTAITHLRDVLGEATYETLARKGEKMTTAAMVTYAHDQIDQARTTLEQPTHSMGNTKDRR